MVSVGPPQAGGTLRAGVRCGRSPARAASPSPRRDPRARSPSAPAPPATASSHPAPPACLTTARSAWTRPQSCRCRSQAAARQRGCASWSERQVPAQLPTTGGKPVSDLPTPRSHNPGVEAGGRAAGPPAVGWLQERHSRGHAAPLRPCCSEGAAGHEIRAQKNPHQQNAEQLRQDAAEGGRDICVEREARAGAVVQGPCVAESSAPPIVVGPPSCFPFVHAAGRPHLTLPPLLLACWCWGTDLASPSHAAAQRMIVGWGCAARGRPGARRRILSS